MSDLIDLWKKTMGLIRRRVVFENLRKIICLTIQVSFTGDLMFFLL